MDFQQYIDEFNTAINIGNFIVNALTATVLSLFLAWFYMRYGNAISNRRRFASNFLPLALTTMLVITIVKSSIALSLGLVGALSIVRFRAAIKDPEELTYLFLTLGVGLATGANQPILAFLAMAIIITLLWVNKLTMNKQPFKSEDKLYVNIATEVTDVKQVAETLGGVFSYVELKRMDTVATGLDLSFICKADSIEQIQSMKERIVALSPNTSVSVIDQPDLMI